MADDSPLDLFEGRSEVTRAEGQKLRELHRAYRNRGGSEMELLMARSLLRTEEMMSEILFLMETKFG